MDATMATIVFLTAALLVPASFVVRDKLQAASAKIDQILADKS